ncbi:hypothetical protein GLUCOINTEAF2_0202898 [Komagataeibacter intermedius AF2]|uniref:Uncharacterized protein n=1 Tax=Komagataeibacter intermedius AF2 TaxID=1458464 RepID=A0A0N1FA64_9PROT|nr:hypothetical protein GLUCOINTEAF2_0202898 [Komagataeibacter intermedius AF2]
MVIDLRLAGRHVILAPGNRHGNFRNGGCGRAINGHQRRVVAIVIGLDAALHKTGGISAILPSRGYRNAYALQWGIDGTVIGTRRVAQRLPDLARQRAKTHRDRAFIGIGAIGACRTILPGRAIAALRRSARSGGRSPGQRFPRHIGRGLRQPLCQVGQLDRIGHGLAGTSGQRQAAGGYAVRIGCRHVAAGIDRGVHLARARGRNGAINGFLPCHKRIIEGDIISRSIAVIGQGIGKGDGTITVVDRGDRLAQRDGGFPDRFGYGGYGGGLG